MRPLPALVALLLLGSLLAGCTQPAAPTDRVETAGGAAGGFSDTHVFPGNYSVEGGLSHPLVAGPYEVLKPEVHDLESRVDGAKIQIGLFRPDVPEDVQTPVIVFASPYVHTGMAEPEDLKGLWEYKRLVQNFGPHGYAVAIVPIRGTSDTGGCMDLMGPKERADLDQAVTWLGTQDWSNGNVGMIGLSYSGSTAWEVAATGNPHLKTIVPVGAVNDFFHLMYHNGTSEERGPGRLNAVYYQDAFIDYNAVDGTRSVPHMVEGAACPEMMEGFGAAAHSHATGERDPFGFWAERNQRPGVEANYNGSIFLVQGLADRNVDPSQSYPWVNELEQQGIVVKHLLGQWAHSFPDIDVTEDGRTHPRVDFSEILFRWFERWLKEDTSVDLGPRAQVQDNLGLWRSEDAWPPADATPVMFHVTPDGGLARDPSTTTGQTPVAPSHHGIATTRDFDTTRACAACPVFTTPPFEAEFRFAGVPQVHVTVTPTGPGGHVAAWLFVVDGSERTPVGWGQIDLRFAAGGETAEAVTPGEPVLARMVLEPLDVMVPAGSSLQLQIHQGTYTDHVPSAPTYPVLLHTGGDASTLTVLSFERGEDAFFTPPGKA